MPGLLPLLGLLCLSLFRLHPIHVTVSDVTVRETSVEWNIRIYTDDLLLAMYGKHATPRRIGEPNEIRRDLLKYLGKHIRLEQEGVPASWAIAHIGQDPEAVSVSLIGNLRSASASFRILNNTLTEVYSDQKNIINLSVNGRELNFLFEKGDGPRNVNH